jgi:hypothetical protein
LELAAELPAALLARVLGIHISVAVAWQRASSGDWTGYAADVSRRNPSTNVDQSDENPADRAPRRTSDHRDGRRR